MIRHSGILLIALISIFVLSCAETGTGGDELLESYIDKLDFSNLYPYRTNTLYSSHLSTCAKVKTARDSCLIAALPPLGWKAKSSLPTPIIQTDAILDRLVVSHSWMAENFKKVLEEAPPDLKQLFQSVTMIIIDDNVRPAFYWAMTGAIYLDPHYFWMTKEEKETVKKAADYRASFAEELPYSLRTRYVKDEQQINKKYSLYDNTERKLYDIVFPAFTLLYHELAHANDFLPPAMLSSEKHNAYQSAIALADAIFKSKQQLSRVLTTKKLENSLLLQFADTIYLGKGAKSTLKTTSPKTLGMHFESEDAIHPYAYTNDYEDFALFSETVFMKKNYNIEMELALTMNPEKDNPSCDDYLVEWGIRNRLGNDQVKKRAQLVTSTLVPEQELSSFYTNLDGESPMRVGEGWCSNLVRNPQTRGAEPPPSQDMDGLDMDLHMHGTTLFNQELLR